MSKLEMQHVCYSYAPHAQAGMTLEDISACFDQGKLHAIVGRSGCGKTTLLSLLAGLDRPASGRILLDGQDIGALPSERYRLEHVSLIYQDYNLLPFLTATENIALCLRLKGLGAKQSVGLAEEKLRLVGLDAPFFKRFPATMSGGQQQRVSIARALAMQTDVLLADEPTGNLDSENSDMIVQILADLAHTHHYCVIVVTHDRDIADQADVVFRMRDGKIQSIGPNA